MTDTTFDPAAGAPSRSMDGGGPGANRAAPPPPPPAEPEPDVRWSVYQAASGQTHAKVELEHPTLGTIRLELALTEDGVDVALAPSLASAIRLERDEGRIRALLRERSAKLANLSVGLAPETPRQTKSTPRPHDGRLSLEA